MSLLPIPADVEKIVYDYMDLPELLQLEKEDAKVAKLLAADVFWKRRIRNEFKDQRIKFRKPKNAREEYYRRYLDRVARMDGAFQLGQLCLPFTDVDVLILKNEDTPFALDDFIFGAYLTGCKRYAKARKQAVLFPLWKALHEGDESRADELANEHYIQDNLEDVHFFTPRMIDTWVKLGRQDLEITFSELIFASGNNDVYPAMVEYFLNTYGRRLNEDILRSILDDLKDRIRDTLADNAEEKDPDIIYSVQSEVRRMREVMDVINNYLVI